LSRSEKIVRPHYHETIEAVPKPRKNGVIPSIISEETLGAKVSSLEHWDSWLVYARDLHAVELYLSYNCRQV